MELRHLRYFVAVAEELHFGRAAARLGLTQPPLSQQIRQLEEEIGVELFSRAERRIALTPAGSEFLGYARAALGQVQSGVRSAQRVQRGELGELVVGFISSMAYTYLPWVLRTFRSRFPEVGLVLNEQATPEQMRTLEDGRLHVGLLRGPVKSPVLASTTLLREPFVVALPTNHRLAGARKVSLAHLAQDPMIMYPRRMGGHFYDQILSLCRGAGFTPKVSQEAIQMHVAVGLVSAGIGVALVPASIQLLPIPGVAFRPLAERGSEAEISIAWRVNDSSSVIQAFFEVAREVVSGGIAGLKRYRR